MLSRLLGGLFVAWILSLFNFDKMVINSIYEVCDIETSKDFYYVIFALIGLISYLLKYWYFYIGEIWEGLSVRWIIMGSINYLDIKYI